jgi:hypothetical protein
MFIVVRVLNLFGHHDNPIMTTVDKGRMARMIWIVTCSKKDGFLQKIRISDQRTTTAEFHATNYLMYQK